MAKILAPEGSVDVPIGQPIAITVCFLLKVQDICLRLLLIIQSKITVASRCCVFTFNPYTPTVYIPLSFFL